MYLIAIFEKRVKDLLETPNYNPDGYSEKEIMEMFADDVNKFMDNNKEVYHVGQLMKIPFATETMIGVEIYKV